MNGNDDRDLKRRFTDLRQAVVAFTPPFARLRREMIERRSRSSVTIPKLGFAFASALLLVVTWFAVTRFVNPSRMSGESVLSAQVLAGSWVAPTDFLLDLPGAAYLRTVPSIDVHTDSLILPTPKPADEARNPRNQS